jgi:hypothetical protein
MIIFGSVRFLLKKATKPKPGQTDRFRFSSVWFFRVKISSNRFGSVFSVFSGFSSVFSVWLGFSGLARFWLGFGSVFLVFCL